MSIRIKKNKELTIKQVKMKCDPKLPGGVIEPLQDANFCYIITAPPGSGKSTLIMNLLKNKSMYRNKFDKIFFFSPSAHTLDDLPLPEEQIIEGYDSRIVSAIIKEINEQDDDECKNILFVFDDCVADLKKSDESLSKLAFNRRHKIKGGSLSLIFTTQMLNSVPTTIRRTCTGLFLFMTNSDKERQIIKQEYINLPSYMAENLMNVIFSVPYSFMYIITNKQKKDNKYYRNFDQIILEE